MGNRNYKISPTRKNPFTGFFKDLISGGLETFGLYYSTYRAFVIDNEDPLNLNRLKLVIPQVMGPMVYEYWAFPKNNWSGKNYGSQFLPQLEEVVWVEFEGGRLEHPVWEHGHFGIDDREALHKKDVELEDPNCYWIITPNGFKVKLNDTKNILSILNNELKGVYLKDKSLSLVSDKISLGSEDKSKEPIVLGDTAMELLIEFMEDIGKLDKITTSTGITSTINSSPKWQILENKWKNKWAKFKSKNTTSN